METEIRCHWFYTHPAWGRVMTKEPFSEADAFRVLPDAEKIEGSDVIGAAPSQVGWGASAMPRAS